MLTEIVWDTAGFQEMIGDMPVSADLVVYRRSDGSHIITIYGWSSYEPGHGNTNRALEYLRREFPGQIIAYNCGSPGSDSYAYWKHQLRKGLVEQADTD